LAENFRTFALAGRVNELWYLSKVPGSSQLAERTRPGEGMAISKKNMKIAYSQVHDQAPNWRRMPPSWFVVGIGGALN
jgi:hypothetical protein